MKRAPAPPDTNRIPRRAACRSGGNCHTIREDEFIQHGSRIIFSYALTNHQTEICPFFPQTFPQNKNRGNAVEIRPSSSVVLIGRLSMNVNRPIRKGYRFQATAKRIGLDKTRHGLIVNSYYDRWVISDRSDKIINAILIIFQRNNT